ncbi:MAG TPA: hypothetical protein VIL46_00125, partial [Gemmataceae bacterium]
MQTIRRMTWKAIVAGLLAAAPPAAAQPGAPAPRAALLPPRPMDRGVVTRASSAELPPTGAPVTGSPADSLPLPSPVPPAPQRPARTVWNVRPTGAPVGTPLCTHCRVKNSQPTTGVLGQLVGTRLGAAPSPAPPAEKPAYRWYGYGAAAPDPQALDAHRVEVSPEFYARTGATPGALPAPHSVPMPLPRVPAGAVARAPERSGEPPLGPPGHVIGRSDSNAVST